MGVYGFRGFGFAGLGVEGLWLRGLGFRAKEPGLIPRLRQDGDAAPIYDLDAHNDVAASVLFLGVGFMVERENQVWGFRVFASL